MIALKDSLDSDFVDEVRSLFSKEGALSRAKNFEYRCEQQDMAIAVARALEEERHLVVEAGTGAGKTIAYPAPPLLHAPGQKKKRIISTPPNKPQEQTLNNDNPNLKKNFPGESAGTTSEQGHPDPEKDFAGRIRGGADERPAKLSLPAPFGAGASAGE